MCAGLLVRLGCIRPFTSNPLPADWTAWMGTLLQSYLSQPPPNSGGANATTQLLFSFAPNEASVPAAQQDMGYRLLR